MIFAGQLLSYFSTMDTRYAHPENLAFEDRNPATERVFSCPNPYVADNRQNAIIYALMLASGAFDEWVPQNGDYAPKQWTAVRLQSQMSTIKSRTSSSPAIALRDMLCHPKEMGAELTVVKALENFFGGPMQGYRHKDLDLIFFEG